MVPAGFSPSDILNSLGQAMFGLGYLPTPTTWYDSFIDTNGSDVRIMEMEYTGDSGAYNKIYHAFFVSDAGGNAGLWYTIYYSWDVATHTCLGSSQLDYVSSIDHPDDTTSWTSYFVRLADIGNAADYSIVTFEDGANAPILWLTNFQETRVFSFMPEASSLVTTANYDYYAPPSMFTMVIDNSYFTAAALTATSRSVTGRANSGIGGGDWALATVYGSHAYGVGFSVSGCATHTGIPGLTGNPGLMEQSVRERQPYYTVAMNVPLARAYYDAFFGANFGVLSGANADAFVPTYGDTLVVSAGVEEYEILMIEETSAGSIDWSCLVSRTV